MWGIAFRGWVSNVRPSPDSALRIPSIVLLIPCTVHEHRPWAELGESDALGHGKLDVVRPSSKDGIRPSSKDGIRPSSKDGIRPSSKDGVRRRRTAFADWTASFPPPCWNSPQIQKHIANQLLREPDGGRLHLRQHSGNGAHHRERGRTVGLREVAPLRHCVAASCVVMRCHASLYVAASLHVWLCASLLRYAPSCVVTRRSQCVVASFFPVCQGPPR
eukprot:gene40955-biopygen6533